MTKTNFVSSQYLSGCQRVCELFGSTVPSKVLCSSYDEEEDGTYDDDDDDFDDDYYSPTSWDREPGESDEDYNDRMDDQNSLLEYFS